MSAQALFRTLPALFSKKLFFPAQPPRRLRCSKVERAGNESSFALCRLKLEEPMFRKISYLGFNLQRKEDERWKEFRNKGYFVSGIFPIVPPVPRWERNRRFEGGARFTLSTSRISVSCCCCRLVTNFQETNRQQETHARSVNLRLSRNLGLLLERWSN